MQRTSGTILFILCLFLLPHHMMHGHGFSLDTLVQLGDGSWQAIHTVCLRSLHKKISVASYDVDMSCNTNQLVKSGGRSQANCYMRLGFDVGFNDSTCNDIVCTPMQEFYLPKRGKWAPAYTLKVGDLLLTKNKDVKAITYTQFVQKPLRIYTLEIKKSHTFFVGKHSILTHNMILPLAFNVGLSIPFGSVACGAVGGFFGPIGLVGGIVLGGVIGLTIRAMYEDRIPTYTMPEYDIAFINSHYRTDMYYAERSNAVNYYVAHSESDEVYESSFNVTIEVGQGCNGVQMPSPEEPKKDDKKDKITQVHPNGIYEDAGYHHKNSNGFKSPAPKNGQKALDNSVVYGQDGRNRVGTSEGEIVVLSQTSSGEFHGHVRTWEQLLSEGSRSQKIRNALTKKGFVNAKGKILK